MPTGPCNTCGRGSMCKFKVGTISGCSEWSGMPQEARPEPGISGQGAAQIPPTAGQGGGKGVKKQEKWPNKGEADYRDTILRGMDARYEALTFRMLNSHKYTPDWVVFEDGRPISCHECKGSYALHSQQRARLAFDQAKLEFPGLKWVWAVKTQNGWLRQ